MFRDRAAAVAAGRALAIQSGSIPAEAARYAHLFADHCPTTTDQHPLIGTSSVCTPSNATLPAGYDLAIARALLPVFPKFAGSSKVRQSGYAYPNRAAAVAAGRALATKGGSSPATAARYALIFADAAVKNGAVADEAYAPPCPSPAKPWWRGGGLR